MSIPLLLHLSGLFVFCLSLPFTPSFCLTICMALSVFLSKSFYAFSSSVTHSLCLSLFLSVFLLSVWHSPFSFLSHSMHSLPLLLTPFVYLSSFLFSYFLYIFRLGASLQNSFERYRRR